MALPPLYKYLDVQGGKLTLGNRTFRHAKPSDFNDTEDLTVQSVFPEETNVALEKLVTAFPDILLGNLDRPPTCSSPQREQVQQLQALFRAKPEAVEIVREEFKKLGAGEIYDIEYMHNLSTAFIDDINEFLQRNRVLCVTTFWDSKHMWERYAEQGKGIVLRITPNVEKDSKFQLFRSVSYAKTRPPLYAETSKFVEDALFVNKEARIKEMVDKIVYTKTLEWECESEYRLAMALVVDEQPWDTQPYHPEEITELYLGPNMYGSDSKELIALGRAVNPRIKVLQMRRGPDDVLTCRDVTDEYANAD